MGVHVRTGALMFLHNKCLHPIDKKKIKVKPSFWGSNDPLWTRGPFSDPLWQVEQGGLVWAVQIYFGQQITKKNTTGDLSIDNRSIVGVDVLYFGARSAGTHLSMGSVASLRSTVDDGIPSTWSMMCMIPFVAAKLAWTTVAFTPPPSRVRVRFLPLLTTLKNRSLRGTRVGT